jgi:hypothetical protein
MTPITINPEQLLHYAPMNRNDIILHMALLSLAEDGKLKRNLSKMSRLLNKPRYRLLEAEFRLKRLRLIRIHNIREGSKDAPYWYVYEQPIGETQAETPAAVIQTEPDAAADAPPNRPLFKRLRDAWVGGVRGRTLIWCARKERRVVRVRIDPMKQQRDR